MLSVIIPTENDERTLVRTLSSLVPGAMTGLVSDVLIVDHGSRDGTAKVADAAGCDFIPATGSRGETLAYAAQRARSAWLMFITSGVTLESPWIDEATRFVQDAMLDDGGFQRSAFFRPGTSPYQRRTFSLVARRWWRIWRGPTPEQGLIIHQSHYRDIGGHRAQARDPQADLIARLRKPQTFMLKADALAL